MSGGWKSEARAGESAAFRAQSGAALGSGATGATRHARAGAAATRIAFCLALIATLAGCGGTPRAASRPSPAGSLTAEQVRTLLARHPEALVLDVRNPDEWNDALGHIETARQIPLPELASRLAEIEAFTDKPVITVCTVGARSARAADLLARAGFREVYNLSGGMQAWREKGY